ncbi:MAG: serine hydrolase domain-containing protein [Pseudomonadales bacterium]
MGLSLLAAAATAAAVAAADPATVRWQGLVEALRAEQQIHGIPALALVLLDQGRPVRQAVHTLPGAPALHHDTPFRWGSMSKTVTALAVLQAAHARGVDLHTPVTHWLPRPPYRNPWTARQPVRLVHLLELTAGLADLSRAEFDDNTPRSLGAALQRGAAGRVIRWPPGMQHSYSNVPPGIAAAVLERIGGEPFDEAVARGVFEPLGMSGASFQPLPGLPSGFRADGVTPIPYLHVTFPAFGGLNASPQDMGRLLEALLNRGRVDGGRAIPEPVVERAFRAESSLGARHGLEIAYGAGVYGWVRDGHRFLGHGGDADGYLSRFGLLPEAGRGYLLGINVDDPRLFGRLRRLVERARVRGPDPVLPQAWTTASFTPGKLRSTCSISPGSTRLPRSLSWRSVRPR